jgi:molybdopterin-containing oxidoreductase family iron-sulfur binding subunit
MENKPNDKNQKRAEHLLNKPTKRRSFLKGIAAATAAIATSKSAADNIIPEQDKEDNFWEGFFQKHYKEMSSEDKEKAFKRIEHELGKKYDVSVRVGDPQPLPNVKFVYCLNLSRCNGSRKCVTACMLENNLSRDPQIQYIKVLEMPIGSLDPEKGNLYYEGKSVPKDGKFYLPVQCNQCNNPPCTKVCPVEATWKEQDGIVVVDYDWCIGCRYCQAACPYEARHFNFTTPTIPKDEINPNQNYLSNRIRPKGVMEKCTFCLHRTRNGQNPACHDACPTGARKFGNILDPESEVSKILKEKRVFVLKEELNTIPQFFYYFD